MPKIQLALVALLAGSAGLAACGGDGQLAGLFSSASSTSEPLSFPWPPTVGERYPDLALRDHIGEPVELSSFAGRILLIEPIGMT